MGIDKLRILITVFIIVIVLTDVKKEKCSKSWKSNKGITFHSHIHKPCVMSGRKATEDIKKWEKKCRKSSPKDKRPKKNHPATAYLYLPLDFHPSWILLDLLKKYVNATIKCNRFWSTEERWKQAAKDFSEHSPFLNKHKGLFKTTAPSSLALVTKHLISHSCQTTCLRVMQATNVKKRSSFPTKGKAQLWRPLKEMLHLSASIFDLRLVPLTEVHLTL